MGGRGYGSPAGLGGGNKWKLLRSVVRLGGWMPDYCCRLSVLLLGDGIFINPGLLRCRLGQEELFWRDSVAASLLAPVQTQITGGRRQNRRPDQTPGIIQAHAPGRLLWENKRRRRSSELMKTLERRRSLQCRFHRCEPDLRRERARWRSQPRPPSLPPGRAMSANALL